MNVLLVDADASSFPNLALMKLSAYYKSLGHTVGFHITDPDKICVSSVFKKYSQSFLCSDVEYGGSAYSYDKLPLEIEHICPDYSLYNIDYSMGFTSRGCINTCPFCIVPEKEGAMRDHAHPSEFVRHDKVVLLDNSFTMSPRFKQNVEWMAERTLKVNICQGVDVRRMTYDKACLLKSLKLYNHNFTSKALHIAWDNTQDEDNVRMGIAHLFEAGFKAYSIFCYVLVGYNSTHEEDYYRVMSLWNDYGIYPFVMRYNKRKDDAYLMHLSRWCNNRILFKSCTFEEYLKTRPLT